MKNYNPQNHGSDMDWYPICKIRSANTPKNAPKMAFATKMAPVIAYPQKNSQSTLPLGSYIVLETLTAKWNVPKVAFVTKTAPVIVYHHRNHPLMSPLMNYTVLETSTAKLKCSKGGFCNKNGTCYCRPPQKTIYWYYH